MNEGAATAPIKQSDGEPLAIDSGANGQSLHTTVERDINLTSIACKAYRDDPLFTKILSHPEAHPHFGIHDQLIWTKNQMGRDIVCIPQQSYLRGRRLIEVILDQAHHTIGHASQIGTSCYICRYYWWPSLGTNIKSFCSSCTTCQTTKVSNRRPRGLLHTLLVPD